MSKHTALPWQLINKSVIKDQNDELIATTVISWADFENFEANAEFIVRACNSHTELLEALELLVKEFHPLMTWNHGYDKLFNKASAAIAEAKGEL